MPWPRRIDGKGLIDRRPLAIAFAGFVVLLVSSAALEALRLHSLPAELPLAAGGMVGQSVSRLATGVFGFTGATLALVTLVAVGFSLFTGISWLAVSELVGFLLESLYDFALRTWDRRKDRRLGEIAREERDFVVEAERKREEEHPPLRSEPSIVGIRKLGNLAVPSMQSRAI